MQLTVKYPLVMFWLLPIMVPVEADSGSWIHGTSRTRETKMFGNVLGASLHLLHLYSKGDTVTLRTLRTGDKGLLLLFICALGFLGSSYQLRQRVWGVPAATPARVLLLASQNPHGLARVPGKPMSPCSAPETWHTVLFVPESCC